VLENCQAKGMAESRKGNNELEEMRLFETDMAELINMQDPYPPLLNLSKD
jgi:hypothetical protein